jgi:hypothetical protein
MVRDDVIPECVMCLRHGWSEIKFRLLLSQAPNRL